MEIAYAVVIGVAAGVISGVAGIGGGVVLIPAMVFLLGIDQHTAQGTSLVAILFTALSGTYINLKNRRVDLKTGLVVGLGGAVGAVAMSAVAVETDAEVLQRMFGVLVLYSGIRMGVRSFRSRTPKISG